MKTRILFILMVFALASLACTIQVNVPKIETGTLQTLEISEHAPSGPASLRIEMGAGKLSIGGDSDELASGKIEYNVSTWKPIVTRNGDNLAITQRTEGQVGIPEGNVINNWNLFLGSYPLDVLIEAGAYRGILEFGGLSITRLEINDGASKADLLFSKPNQAEMSLLSYKTGASQISLSGLGNANFDEMSFAGGAGSYTLNLSGDWRKDARIRIAGGMSDMKIIVPEDLHTRIILSGGLSNVSPQGTWSIHDNVYEAGAGEPFVEITIEMAVGNLTLIRK